MAVGLVLIGLLLVALPLAAVALAVRLPKPVLRDVCADPFYELAKRHRLRGADFVEVERAVAEGRLAEPERLRPAAADRAELLLTQFRPNTRLMKVLVALLVVWLVLLVAQLMRDPWTAIYLAYTPLLVVMGRRARRRYQRALELNRDGAPADVGYDTTDGG